MIVLTPANLDALLQMKADHPEAVVLAGGTDLMPLWSREGRKPETILSLAAMGEMKGVRVEAAGLRVGAGATHGEIAGHEEVIKNAPALARAAASIGAPAIRNMGTLGGNLVTASPAADLPPALLALDAEIRIGSRARGMRSLPLHEFFTGYRTVALDKDEVVIDLLIPIPLAEVHSYFRKVGARKAQACAKTSLALQLVMEENRIKTCRAAAGSVAPIPLRLEAVETLLQDQILTPDRIQAAKEAAMEAASPIDDIRSTADYRRFVLGSMMEDFLRQTAGKWETP
jgi:CO/xanthine dehydrogenase FAD-binding subunit